MLIVLILPSFCWCQAPSYDTITEDGNFKMSKVMPLDGLSKDQIYDKAKAWIFKTFPSGKSVMQNEDKESGKIICQGNTGQLTYTSMLVKMNGGRFKYNLTIFSKDGKAKILISEITHIPGEITWMKAGSNYSDDYPSQWPASGGNQAQKQWVKMKAQALSELDVIVVNFTTSMVKQNTDDNF